MDLKRRKCNIDCLLCPTRAKNRVPGHAYCETVAGDQAVFEAVQRASFCIMETEDQNRDWSHHCYSVDPSCLA